MPAIDTENLKLPVMPEVAQLLIRTLNDEDATAQQLTDVIGKDPALTTTLLRMANSAAFGLSHTVTTLQRAVNVVGMSKIRVRALGICMSQVFVPPAGLDHLEFWRYSMACAGNAQWLAKLTGQDQQQAWLAGMMLRLGELIMLEHAPGIVQVLEKTPCTTPERWAREIEQLGMDEGQITSKIFERWHFPDHIVMALAAVGRPTDRATYSSLGAVVHLAALLADDATASPESIDALPQEVLQLLGLDAEDLHASVPSAESLNDVSMLQA